jgi:hypothetical protein
MTARAKMEVPNQLNAAVDDAAILLGPAEAAAAKIATGNVAKIM